MSDVPIPGSCAALRRRPFSNREVLKLTKASQLPTWDQLTVRVLPNDPSSGRKIEEEILRQLPEHGFDDSDIFAVKLSLDEALINAIRHGNQYDRSKKITVGYLVDDEQVIITVADQGSGFDPGTLSDPTTETNRWKQGGRGIFLIRAYMDEVAFNERGNQIWLIKKMNCTPS